MNKQNYAFEQMRDIQVDILERIEEAFKTKKFVMLELPTGGGKSGIIMSAALQLGESYINTSSKLLQDQYLRDFPYIHTVKGKSNFECVDPNQDTRLFGKLTCDKGACQFSKNYICESKPKKEHFIVLNRGTKNQSIRQKQSLESESCRYFTQKMQGFAAGHTILNYKYFFSIAFYTDELNSRRLLVFDEAHNIENEILDFISISPNTEKYSKLYNDLVKDNDELADNIVFVNYPVDDDKVESWTEYLKGTARWMGEVFRFYEDMPNLPIKVVKALSDLESTLKKVEHISSLMETDKDNWVVDLKTYLGKIQSIKISPIETGKYVRPIFDFGDKVLLTSATLLDREVFASMIGVTMDEVEFIRIDESPFPKENRPIYLRNVGEMNYKTIDSLMPAIVNDIDNILQHHEHERGIIHTTSYKQLDYIMRNSKNKSRLIKTEAGVPQSEILKKHSLKENGVLISPSMKEGVDLKDDLSRFQIVVKIPYSDLSDKRTMIKMRRSYNWYMWHTVLALVQQIGRSIRNEKDYATTYILDSKASQIINNKFCPRYIKEAVK